MGAGTLGGVWGGSIATPSSSSTSPFSLMTSRPPRPAPLLSGEVLTSWLVTQTTTSSLSGVLCCLIFSSLKLCRSVQSLRQDVGPHSILSVLVEGLVVPAESVAGIGHSSLQRFGDVHVLLLSSHGRSYEYEPFQLLLP
jgi:hypothetical protein